MALTFYQSDLSPYATRVRILADAKGIKLDSNPPVGGGLKSAEYLRINPLGRLPVLMLGSEALPESEVICEYLEDSHPSPTLRPVDPQVRAKVRLLSRMGDLYIAPLLTRLFPMMNPRTRDAAIVDQAFGDMDKALGQIAHFLEGPDYAVGNRLSLADCTLSPLLFFVEVMLAPTFGRPSPLTGKMRTYYDGVSKDPHVAKGLKEMQAVLTERQKAQAAAAAAKAKT
jgi:glutathione S-transferase